MLLRLLKFDWLGFRRAPYWGQSVAVNVMMGFLAVYFLLTALALGFMAEAVIRDMYPGADVLQKFSGFFALYVIADICIRFLMQKYPSFALSNYLTLNIKKSTITKYLLTKSLVSFFNIFPLFAILPFYFTYVRYELGSIQGVLWLGVMIMFVLINNFLSYTLDRNLSKHPLPVFIILAGIALLLYAEFKEIFSLIDYIAPLVSVLYQGVWILVPMLILSGLCFNLYRQLRNNAYIDSGQSITQSGVTRELDLQFLDTLGESSRWLKIELLLIWRNKKSRTYTFLSLVFLVYPFVLGIEILDNVYAMIGLSIFMVGAFMMNYGQLLFSWNSAHFDFLLTQNLGLYNFLRSKYILIAGSNAIFFVFSLPYVFYNPKIVLINFVMMLFNAGLITYFLMWFTMHNSKKMSVSKGAMFNYEGVTAAHFLLIIPVAGLPIAIFAIFDAMGYQYLGLMMLGLIGLLGIVYNKLLITKALTTFNYKKYIMHNNFTK